MLFFVKIMVVKEVLWLALSLMDACVTQCQLFVEALHYPAEFQVVSLLLLVVTFRD